MYVHMYIYVCVQCVFMCVYVSACVCLDTYIGICKCVLRPEVDMGVFHVRFGTGSLPPPGAPWIS